MLPPPTQGWHYRFHLLHSVPPGQCVPTASGRHKACQHWPPPHLPSWVAHPRFNPKQKRVFHRLDLPCIAKKMISNHFDISYISYISSEQTKNICCSHSRSNHSTHPTGTWYTHRSGTQPLGSWSFKLRNLPFSATSSKYNGNSSDFLRSFSLNFHGIMVSFQFHQVIPQPMANQLIGAKALFNTSLELHTHCSTPRDDDLFHRNVGLNLNPVLLGQSRQGVFDTLPTWYEMMHEWNI